MAKYNHRFNLNIRASTYEEALELYHVALKAVADHRAKSMKRKEP